MLACAPAAPTAPAKPTAPPAPAVAEKTAPQPTTPPAKPAEAKPAEAKPAEPKPAASPAAKPAEAKPAEAKPAASPAAKPAGPAYYEGKRVTLLIGVNPGSSSDIMGRILIKHLPKYVPGAPSFVPQNMGGGAGLAVMSQLYNAGPFDGTAMAMPTGGIYMREVLGMEGIQYKLSEMIPMYNPEGGGAVVFVSSKLGIKEPKDIAKITQPLNFGYSTPEGNSSLLGIAGFKMLGVPVKPIGGYTGTPEIILAVQRGELDAGWQSSPGYKSALKPLVDSGEVVPVFQSGLWRPADNSLVSHPGLEQIPMFQDLYRAVKGTPPSGPLWDAWYVPLISYSRYTIFFPPRVPEQALREMQIGFEGVCKDPEFKADFQKIDVDPTCYLGEDARRVTERSSRADPAAVEALKSIVPKP
jgi:tripartite-type tricarboxylate transporter receptor subunit TctC